MHLFMGRNTEVLLWASSLPGKSRGFVSVMRNKQLSVFVLLFQGPVGSVGSAGPVGARGPAVSLGVGRVDYWDRNRRRHIRN